jgi:hypothetical protein
MSSTVKERCSISREHHGACKHQVERVLHRVADMHGFVLFSELFGTHLDISFLYPNLLMNFHWCVALCMQKN